MTTRYRLGPSHGRFTVQAFAAGLLSFFGHSPTFAVRDFTGVVALDGDPPAGMTLEVRVRADGLELVDDVKASDRREIEDRMRREVLETTAHPEIVYEGGASAEHVEGGRYQVRVDGRLSLHGVTRAHPLAAELLVFGDGIRLRGESSLRLSDYRIRPVTALAGAIKLKDELKLVFDVAALPEGS